MKMFQEMQIYCTANMNNIANIDQKLLASLQNSFADIPEALIDDLSQENETGGRFRHAVIIRTMVGDRPLDFVAETRGDLYPRDAREAVWQIKRRQKELKSSNRHYFPMIVAQSVSDGARAFLREENVAYHDLSGSLYFSADDVFVLIEKPKSRRAKRRDANVFQGSRAQVLHALVARPGEWVAGTEIAADAGVSPATVSQTFKHLERRDWLEVKGEGPAKRRLLTRPDALLDAWRDSVLAGPKARRSRYYVPRKKPEEMARQIRQEASGANFYLEFTGQFAAQSYAPFLSSVSDLAVRVHGKQDLERLLSILGARKVSEGANLIVIDARSKKRSRKRNEADERLLATPLQVYLDLLEDHGRSKEMAEHLRSQKLAWQ